MCNRCLTGVMVWVDSIHVIMSINLTIPSIPSSLSCLQPQGIEQYSLTSGICVVQTVERA